MHNPAYDAACPTCFVKIGERCINTVKLAPGLLETSYCDPHKERFTAAAEAVVDQLVALNMPKPTRYRYICFFCKAAHYGTHLNHDSGDEDDGIEKAARLAYPKQ
jgi:hypothetical protein